VEKYFRAGLTTDLHSMLDTQDYKQTLSTCYICCFSTTTMVAQTRLIVKLIRTVPILFIISSAAEDSVF